MNKFFNQLKRNKTKYIIGVLLMIVLLLFIYILNNQENKIEKLSKSVLMLNIYNTKNELVATGSGFVAFEKDILVTNYHVIEDGYKIEAVDEKDIVYSLDKVVAYNKKKDLAILKFRSPTNLKVLKLYNSSKVSKGDDIITIGSPIGLKNTVSKGIISSIREENDGDIIQISAPISSGSSGGALLNEDGKVIGVTFAGIEEGQNLNFAIPSNEVLRLYNKKFKEFTVQDFYLRHYPDEKYKMNCVKVSLVDILGGKCNNKDVCVSGWIPELLYIGNKFYLTNQKSNLDYYAYEDLGDDILGRILLMSREELENNLKSICVELRHKNGIELSDGAFITVYGKVTDKRNIINAIIEVE